MNNTIPSPPISTPAENQRKYSFWFWLLLVVIIALFALILKYDPYYKQVPLLGVKS